MKQVVFQNTEALHKISNSRGKEESNEIKGEKITGAISRRNRRYNGVADNLSRILGKEKEGNLRNNKNEDIIVTITILFWILVLH